MQKRRGTDMERHTDNWTNVRAEDVSEEEAQRQRVKQTNFLLELFTHSKQLKINSVNDCTSD